MWMSKTFAAIVSLIVANAMLPACAAPVHTISFQDSSCGQWAASSNEAMTRQVYVFWIRGFLSGHNYANQSQQTKSVTNETIALFVDKFCRDNPLMSFEGAAFRLSDELSGRNHPISK